MDEHATILKLSCPDRVGLLARLTNFFAQLGGNLLEAHQFTDPIANWFFVRLAIDSGSLPLELRELQKAFAPVARELQAEWTLRDSRQRMRMALLASKQQHCLADLILRWRLGEIPAEIPLVLSNHEDLRPLVEREGIPFRHVPVDPTDKDVAFREIAEALEACGVELVVLARYMQILPEWFCERYAGRVINIHHSFLPAFVGANPYRRAWERGVKLIGATCHYATAELDAGPIIDQEVMRVEHYHTPEDLLRLGRDCERLALARGVRYHVTDRALQHGGRTIVFRD
jgi:formyltetrahydrofolate deformylase